MSTDTTDEPKDATRDTSAKIDALIEHYELPKRAELHVSISPTEFNEILEKLAITLFESDRANAAVEKLKAQIDRGYPDTVTVTWGAEKYCPVPYHSMDIGPFTMKTKIQPFETEDEAFDRAWNWLTRRAAAYFAAKIKDFRERC